MFLDIDKKDASSSLAIDDEGKILTYGEMVNFSNEFYDVIKKRSLIFILSENNIGSLSGFLASLQNKIVPLILSANLVQDAIENLISIYQPEFIWLPEHISDKYSYKSIYQKYNYNLLATGFPSIKMYGNLSLLLATSGSTGSPKLVRHSYENISSNAKNVAEFFQFNSNDRGIGILPIHYTMGLSVACSHIYVGATILLIKSSLTDLAFWEFIKNHKATNFTGVPYSFEILKKLRFFRMNLPDLKLISQGGGKLNSELFLELADYAKKNNKKFIATYGQTEGTARMAYLPSEDATEKIGSIGKAIPNGKLSVVDDNNNEIETNVATGEMKYEGKNVTLGYALSKEDLLKGDERNGVIMTGDIVRRDKDGYFYITGRISRFLKLYGTRISLDEIENAIKNKFNIECVCGGDDTKMKILITNEELIEIISQFVAEQTGLFHQAFDVIYTEKILRNEFGKVIYQKN